MKNLIIKNCMTYIKNNTDYNETKLKEIEYGLTGLYLTISKFIVIIIISIYLRMFKEMLIFICLFNVIRMPAFGLHATKSWICLISSILIFIGLPIICINLSLNNILKVIIGLICTLLMLKNSPADTYKRPIVSKKRRKVYNTISVIISIVFSIISVNINNNFISNCLIFALILENCLISPYVYKLFKLPYNNYITYIKNHPDVAI